MYLIVNAPAYSSSPKDFFLLAPVPAEAASIDIPPRPCFGTLGSNNVQKHLQVYPFMRFNPDPVLMKIFVKRLEEVPFKVVASQKMF